MEQRDIYLQSVFSPSDMISCVCNSQVQIPAKQTRKEWSCDHPAEGNGLAFFVICCIDKVWNSHFEAQLSS